MNVCFEQRPALNGLSIAIATLDAPASLNALSVPMLDALDQQLQQWAADPNIACVLLRGSGPKGFCAGGNVRQLVEAQRQQIGRLHPLVPEFFAKEYRLDHRIHTYPKPLLCWGHGYVMGGGMGLLQGASIRIVCEDTKLAMPEINIGLYPDAGGTWFLGKMPKPWGLFFGLTGAQLNASDALRFGLADRFLLNTQQDELLNELCLLNWNQQPQQALHSLLKRLEQQAHPQRPAPQWSDARQKNLEHMLDVADLPSAWHAITAQQHNQDPLIAQAAHSLAHGCPMTAHLVWQQLQRCQHLSLAQTLQVEYTVSLNCCLQPDFIEGVRSRLIDKDGAPNWHWTNIDSIPQAAIETHYTTCWEGPHPLIDL